jgi:hypothetical protein
MGVLRKKLKHIVIQKYFFLEILINVKAGRVNYGARKAHHGRRLGQACCRPFGQCFKMENFIDSKKLTCEMMDNRWRSKQVPGTSVAVHEAYEVSNSVIFHRLKGGLITFSSFPTFHVKPTNKQRKPSPLAWSVFTGRGRK